MNADKDKTDMLVWIDVETTGLDPDKGDLLEVELVLTDLKGEKLDRVHHVIAHDADTIKTGIDHGGLNAIAMHFRNDLLVESLTGRTASTITLASLEINDKLREWADGHRLHPAGTNVDFDLAWLNRHLTYTTRLNQLNHRKLDLTSLRLTGLALGHDPYQNGHGPDATHRTRDCLTRDLTEYRHILDQLATKETA